MHNEELLKIIKSQGEGIVFLKNDYKFILDSEKENKPYDYSRVNSIVFDGVNKLEIIYANFPADSTDFLNRYTNLKRMNLTLDELAKLNFID